MQPIQPIHQAPAPAAAPVAAPPVQPATQPVAAPQVQPVAQPAPAPVAQSAAAPVVAPAQQQAAAPATTMGMRVDPSQHERRVARPDRPYPGTLLVRIDGVQPKTSRKNQPYLQISMTLVAYVAPPTSPLPPHLQGVVPHPGTKYSVPIYQGDYYEKDVTTLLCAAHNCEPSQLNASFFDAMVGPSQALRGVFLLSEAWHSYSQKNDIAPDGSVFPGRKGFLNWMPHNALGTLEEVRQYVVDDATYQRVVVNGG